VQPDLDTGVPPGPDTVNDVIVPTEVTDTTPDSSAHDALDSELATDVSGDVGPDEVLDTSVEPNCTSPFVYLKDKQFRLGNQPFVPISVNYIFDIRHTPTDEYYIGPHSAFCTTPAGCCNDAPSCRAAAQEQLAQIKALGFNSLRVVGLAVIPQDGTVVLDCSHQWPDWLDYCPKEARLVMSPPDPRGLALIADALTLVKEAGLKAILLAGHGAVDADLVRDHYATYLQALAAHLVDEPTVFAYDLTNEPVYEFANKDIDKVAANAIGRAWYDAMRAGSPRHMVTMGLAEIGTVRHWDPGAVPLDFTSFHIYGSGKWKDADRDHLSTFLAWAGREPYPTMVGETGLGVEPGALTETDQWEFAQHALDTAWACGAMGLQWWLYRDVHWGPPGEHYGLVRWDATVRPAAQPFTTFTPVIPRPACLQPAYLGNAPDGIFHTRGRLIREDGTPVANGYVSGHKCLSGGYEWTLSQADGTYDLRSTNPINELEVTAAGLSVENTELLCNLVAPGDITLRALPLSMAVSTPSSCPR